MLTILLDMFPQLTHFSIVTLAGFSICASNLLLYLLSRTNHYAVIAGVAAIYATVPLMPPHLF